MKKLKNKIVVITGAGSGIGRCLAEQCAERGARLALCDVDADGLEQTAARCAPAETITRIVDVSDRAAVEAFRDQVLATYDAVDLVINNAGVTVLGRIENTSYDDFEWIMGINFWGVVYGTQSFLPALKARKEASLVNISSLFGLLSIPTQGSYNASKFAVRGYTEALRHEMAGSNLHVMCVHPGGIRTNIVRNSRFFSAMNESFNHDQMSQWFDKIARTTPESAAKRILKDLADKRGRCLIGADARLMDKIVRAAPETYWSVMSRFVPG